MISGQRGYSMQDNSKKRLTIMETFFYAETNYAMRAKKFRDKRNFRDHQGHRVVAGRSDLGRARAVHLGRRPPGPLPA
jgi:hypothetical protein